MDIMAVRVGSNLREDEIALLTEDVDGRAFQEKGGMQADLVEDLGPDRREADGLWQA
jgi:hypothetical protein